MNGNLQSIKVSGNAVSSDGAKITRLEVFDGTKSIYATTVSSTLNEVPTLGLAIGPHAIQLKATDSAGGVGMSAVVNIVLTGTPPNAEIIAPEQGGRYGALAATGNVTVTGTAVPTSGSTITRIELFENGTLLGSVGLSSPASITKAYALGPHTVEWRITDGRGTATSRFVDFVVVPAVAPTVTITEPTDGAQIAMTGDLMSIKASGVATFSDHAKLVKFDVMDGDTSLYTTTVSSTLVSVPTLGIKMGPHTIRLRATDSVGMVGYSPPVQITLTGAPPEAAILSPAPGDTYGALTTTGTVSVTGTAVPKDGAKITRIELFENGTLLGSVGLSSPATITKTYALGPHKVEWRITDSRGSATSQDVDFVVVPAVAPSVTITEPVNGAQIAMTGDLMGIKASGVATFSDHAKLVKFDVMDGDTSLYTTTVSSTLVSVPTVGMKMGPHTIRLRATDSVGMVGYSPPVQITLTGTPPDAAILAPASGDTYGALTTTGTVPVTGTAVPKDGAKITRIELFENGTLLGAVGLSSPATITKTYALGPHKVEWRITDSRGSATSQYVDFVVVPAVAPAVSMTSPVEGAVIPMTGVAFPVTVSGGATASNHATITKMEVLDGSKVVYSGSSSPLNNVSTSGLAIGLHALQLRATDSVGKVSTSPVVNITLTGTPPTAAITAPVNGAAFPTSGTSATVAISGNAYGTSGATIAKIELFEGTTLLASAGATNVTTLSKAFNLGAHTVEWRATDTRGQANSSYLSFTVVAGQVPTISMSAPLDGASFSITSGTSFAVPVIATAAAASPATISKMEVLDGTTVKYTLANSGAMNTTVALAPGAHAVQIRVTDSVGKTALSNIANLNISVPAPTVVISAPLDGAALVATSAGAASVAVKGTATPFNGAAIAAVELMEGDTVLQSGSSATISMTQPFAPGAHSIILRVTDSTGQQVSSVPVKFTVYPQVSGSAAVYVSQDVPAVMRTAQPYSVTVSLLNTGTTTWTEASQFRLGSVTPQDNRTWNSTGRAYLTTAVAPGAIGTFTIPVTAPQKAGLYNFQWRMVQDGTGWFGDATDNLPVTVADGAGPSATLTATPTNARMVGSTPVTLTLSANAAETGRKVTRLDILLDKGAGYAATPVKSITGTTASLKLDFTTTATAGVYKYKARSTDDLGIQTDTDNIIVNIADSTVLGTVAGIRIDRDNKPVLVGWLCQPGVTTALAYEILLDAPTSAAGGTQLTTGVADVGGEPDDASVQSACGTPGISHGFKVDLSGSTSGARKMALRNAVAASAADTPYTNAYAGRALYVHALNVGAAPAVLPCADNGCTMPGSIRIALATPADGATVQGPDTLFARMVVSGTSDPVDEVAIAVDGSWITAQPDTAVNAYFVNFPNLQPRSAPHVVQARVRQGNTTLYSTPNQVTMTARPLTTLSLTSPAGGATVAVGVPVTLSAAAAGVTAGLSNVKFYANGVLVGDAANASSLWSRQWTPTTQGLVTLQAIGYDANGQQLAASTPASVTVSGAGNGALIPVAISPPYLGNTDAGSLPGALSAGNAGTAEYHMPLTVPPGTAGMAPELTLDYSSNGANGIAGLGWSVGGLSTIHRCAKTIAQDGVAGRIGFDNADRLCLDGQRLVRANGGDAGSDVNAADAAYWVADAQYRTELDSFSRITRQGGGFKVERKDGRIQYYGNFRGDSGSTIAAQGRTDGQALLWAIGGMEDRAGNYLTYAYSQDGATGEYLPTKIRYGGNAAAGQQPDLAVSFEYEPRNDAQIMYMGGAHNDLRQRLTHIRTYIGTAADGGGGTQVRDHTLHYVQSAISGRSLIDWMQACADTCLPKTTFDWGQGPALALAPTNRPLVALPSITEGRQIVVHGNFDGSGIDTFIAAEGGMCPPKTICDDIPPLSGKLRIRSADGTTFDRNLNFVQYVTQPGLAPMYLTHIAVADLNGDGRDDLVVWLDYSWTVGRASLACLSVTGSDGKVDFVCKPGSAPHSNSNLVDLNNDRRMHLLGFDKPTVATDCYLEDGALTCKPLNMQGDTWNYPNDVAFATNVGIDLSRQGRSDFVRFFIGTEPALDPSHPSGGPGLDFISYGNVCYNRQEGLTCKNIGRIRHPENGPGGPSLVGGLTLGDLNGDGLTDFTYIVTGAGSENGTYVCLSSETGADCHLDAALSKYPETNGSSADVAVSAKVGDFVGDGVNRLLFSTKPNKDDLSSAKSVLCSYTLAGMVCQEFAYSAAADVDVEPVYLDYSGVPMFLAKSDTVVGGQTLMQEFTLAGIPAQDLLVGVTNGVALHDEVQYSRGNDPAVFSWRATVDGAERLPTYPQMLRNPGAMVSQLYLSTGINRISTSFQYAGMMTDVTGRGSLGFGSIQRRDPHGDVTSIVLSQSYPFAGMIERSQKTAYQSGYLLSDIRNTPEQQALVLPNGARICFPYIGRTVETRRDLDNSDLGTTSVVYQYADGWGNLTGRQVTATGGERVFGNALSATYRNDADAWLVGLPTLLSNVASATGVDSVTRTTRFDYDLTHGWLNAMTIEPGATDLQIVTTYDRSGNVFGLVNKETLVWKDPLTQSMNSRIVSDVTYDAQGRFPDTVRDALGHAEKHRYAPGTGVQIGLLDANQLATSWSADGFGRPLTELRPDGNETRSYNKRCDGSCPSGAQLVHITENFHGGDRISVPAVDFLDSAGHVLRTMSWGFDPLDNRAVIADRRYDVFGNLIEVDRPHFEGEAAYLAQRLSFDSAGRSTDVTTFDEAGAERKRRARYQGLTSIYTDAREHSVTEIRDVLGQVRQKVDAKAGMTEYGYDATGNLIRTSDPNRNVIQVSYDLFGHKTDLLDPDLGWIHYDVDPIGQVLAQTSPNDRKATPSGQKTRFEYDAGGRLSARYERNLNSYWVYDKGADQADCASTRSCGKLVEAYTATATFKDYDRTHTYDDVGRPARSAQVLYDATYSATPSYDAWGRLSATSYQRGNDPAKVFDLRYNGNGYLARIERGPLALWQVTMQDAASRVTEALLGNGLIDARIYSPWSGRQDGASLHTATQLERLRQTYHYDEVGNVKLRGQYWGTGGFDETFMYDELNRLTDQVIGLSSQKFRYDAVGNIQSKSGVGTGDYAYPPQGVSADHSGVAPRPHAVKSIPGIGGFIYDDNGNLTEGAGRMVSWTSFDMPSLIQQGASSSGFAYGPEYQRTRQDRSEGGPVVYADAQEVEGNGTLIKTYWPNGLGFEIDRAGAGSSELNWVHRDRLGSVVAITDANGEVVEQLEYDAWGKRRSALDNTGAPERSEFQRDNKGYTGHEMLDGVGLVHMNGRVYDPMTGTFLSADPFIPDPMNGQGFGRYTYVLNNPTNFVDPSGFDDETPQQVMIFGNFGSMAGAFSGFGGMGFIGFNAQRGDTQQNFNAARRAAVANTNKSANSRNSDPSYLERSLVAAKGEAAGMFQVIVHGIGGTIGDAEQDRQTFENMGHLLYGNSILAEDFQNGHNFGYLLGFGSSMAAARAKPSPPATAVTSAATVAEDMPVVVVSRSRYPESAQHIIDAQSAGHPSTVTIDRAGAKSRRKAALSKFKSKSGSDRDEYPPAVFQQGGKGSSVRYIDPSDNRGAGACIGAQCRPYPDGTSVLIQVID